MIFSENYKEVILPDTQIYATIPCAICGKEHEELVIDNHISQPCICDKCVRKIIKEWLKES